MVQLTELRRCLLIPGVKSMDFNQCFAILQTRASGGQNSAEYQSSRPVEKVAASVLAADNFPLPKSATAMEMISCLHALQAERIKVGIGGFALAPCILLRY
jgi:hypothetical protein